MRISPILGGHGRHSGAQGSRFPPHEHQDWEFVFYTSGNVVVRQGDGDIPASAGTLLTTPPHTSHSEFGITPYSNIYLQVFSDPDTPWPLVVHDDASGSMARVLETLADEDPSEMRMRTLLFEQLELLMERSSSRRALSNPALQLVLRAERRLRDRLTDPFTLAALANELRVAPSTLRLAFLRERKMPPRERFAEIRMQQALSQIRNSTMTLEHIAHVTGFSSASHLSHSVKNATGRSPKDIRQG